MRFRRTSGVLPNALVMSEWMPDMAAFRAGRVAPDRAFVRAVVSVSNQPKRPLYPGLNVTNLHGRHGARRRRHSSAARVEKLMTSPHAPGSPADLSALLRGAATLAAGSPRPTSMPSCSPPMLFR
jgi:hypothetical protein